MYLCQYYALTEIHLPEQPVYITIFLRQKDHNQLQGGTKACKLLQQ